MNRRISVALALFAVVLFLPACQSAVNVQSGYLDQTPRVIIISVFNEEMQLLKSHTQITRTYVINGRTYYLGQLAGTEVVLVLGGMSMVNATMTAQTAILLFNPRAIINTGIAGGVNPDLDLGDVVVPAQWTQYLESEFARETPQGWQLIEPFTKEIEPYGMIFPQKVRVARKNGPPDAEEWYRWFPVSPELLATAKRAAAQVTLGKCTPKGVCLDHDPKVVVGGNGASASVFVDNADFRQWVWRAFQADALDMESAAIAQVAYVNDVPFIAFRSLSDLAGGGPSENEQWIFWELAGNNSSTVVETFLRAWAAR